MDIFFNGDDSALDYTAMWVETGEVMKFAVICFVCVLFLLGCSEQNSPALYTEVSAPSRKSFSFDNCKGGIFYSRTMYYPPFLSRPLDDLESQESVSENIHSSQRSLRIYELAAELYTASCSNSAPLTVDVKQEVEVLSLEQLLFLAEHEFITQSLEFEDFLTSKTIMSLTKNVSLSVYDACETDDDLSLCVLGSQLDFSNSDLSLSELRLYALLENHRFNSALAKDDIERLSLSFVNHFSIFDYAAAECKAGEINMSSKGNDQRKYCTLTQYVQMNLLRIAQEYDIYTRANSNLDWASLYRQVYPNGRFSARSNLYIFKAQIENNRFLWISPTQNPHLWLRHQYEWLSLNEHMVSEKIGNYGTRRYLISFQSPACEARTSFELLKNLNLLGSEFDHVSEWCTQNQ